MPLVCPQMTSLTEGLSADLTAVRLLPRVDSQMQLEAVCVVEFLLAEITGERPVF